MSRYFVNDPPVPVFEFDASEVLSDTPPNVIWIRARMDVETRGKVSSELVKLGGDNKTMEMQLGANQTALLIHNIVKWAGPDFDTAPCDAAHIRTLDPNEPHIEKVLEEIERRNKKKAAPNPKSSTEPGFVTNGSHDASRVSAPGISHPSEISILKSPLLRALDGHQNRSGD